MTLKYSCLQTIFSGQNVLKLNLQQSTFQNYPGEKPPDPRSSHAASQPCGRSYLLNPPGHRKPATPLYPSICKCRCAAVIYLEHVHFSWCEVAVAVLQCQQSTASSRVSGWSTLVWSLIAIHLRTLIVINATRWKALCYADVLSFLQGWPVFATGWKKCFFPWKKNALAKIVFAATSWQNHNQNYFCNYTV